VSCRGEHDQGSDCAVRRDGARRARGGLLTSEALERLLRDAIRRRQAVDALLAIAGRVAEAWHRADVDGRDRSGGESRSCRAPATCGRSLIPVLRSGLFWRGRPHALMEQARAGTITSVTHELLADPRWRRGPGSDAGCAP
jgi:hypothetical protein